MNDSLIQPRRRRRAFLFLIVLCVLAYGAFRIFQLLCIPASTFPVPYTIALTKGESVTALGNELYASGALSDVTAFKITMRMLGGESHLAVGEYYFDHPVSLLDLALRFSGSNFGISRTKITIPEGFTAKDISVRLNAALHTFTPDTFRSIAQPHEGYLFPDTYLFFPTVTKEEILQTMLQTFTDKTKDLQSQAQAQGKNWNDIVTMASIIEKEAKGSNDRAIISGILWKRLSDNIALQVDATALYAPNDNRYNSYNHKGLPPTPIANPGLAALEAALNPQMSDYLYYLHDKTGAVHYASTFSEHEANIQKYLK
jgi:UPF0755 protein